MNRREPVFRVKKLDLIIALLTADVSLHLVNSPVGSDTISRGVIAAIAGVVVLFLSAVWQAKEA